MKLMCLNGWGGTLFDLLLPYLDQSAPDVLCLQEVVHTPSSQKDWLTYKDGNHVLPQRATLFDDVCAALPNHMAVFCPAARGTLWDDDVAIPSFWGLATFVHRSFAVIGQTQGFVHKRYGHDGYGAHPRSRNAHAVRIFDHANGRAISLAHMHGLRDLKGKGDTPERLAQAERFLALLEAVAEPNDIRIACGDFNVEPKSETLKYLAEAGLTELVTSRGFSGTRTSHYVKPGRYADYMLINDPSVVRRFEVVTDPEVSDHCPLILEV